MCGKSKKNMMMFGKCEGPRVTGERTPTPSCTDGARRIWEDTTWCEEWIQKASLCCGAGSVRVMRVLSGTETDKLLQAREKDTSQKWMIFIFWRACGRVEVDPTGTEDSVQHHFRNGFVNRS